VGTNGFFPRLAQVVIKAGQQHVQDRIPQPAVDLSPVSADQPEMEGEKIVRDPVDLAAGPIWVLGHRSYAFDQPKADEPVEGTAGFSPDPVLDLVVASLAVRDRVKDGGWLLPGFGLGGQNEIALGQ
jgi:hypothetical protein